MIRPHISKYLFVAIYLLTPNSVLAEYFNIFKVELGKIEEEFEIFGLGSSVQKIRYVWSDPDTGFQWLNDPAASQKVWIRSFEMGWKSRKKADSPPSSRASIEDLSSIATIESLNERWRIISIYPFNVLKSLPGHPLTDFYNQLKDEDRRFVDAIQAVESGLQAPSNPEQKWSSFVYLNDQKQFEIYSFLIESKEKEAKCLHVHRVTLDRLSDAFQ